MTNDAPAKSNFLKLALVTTFWMMIGVVVICGAVYFYVMRGHHFPLKYETEHRDWQKRQQAATVHNNFWLVFAGKMKPTDESYTHLALDLRHILIEPSADIEQQTTTVTRLTSRPNKYGSVPADLAEEIGWPWGEQAPPESFQHLVELVKADKVNEILTNAGPEPQANDPKYTPYDPTPKLTAMSTRNNLFAAWAGLSLFVALICGVFRSRGWLHWRPEDAFYKIWLTMMLAPAIALWVACILVWGTVSLPFMALRGGYGRARNWTENLRLRGHPHGEHIMTIKSVIDALETEIAKQRKQGYNTNELEAQLERANRLQRLYWHLPEHKSVLAGAISVLDSAEAFAEALQELEGSGPPVA
jgi:hypothetical protein